jgi:hypothetical protein
LDASRPFLVISRPFRFPRLPPRVNRIGICKQEVGRKHYSKGPRLYKTGAVDLRLYLSASNCIESNSCRAHEVPKCVTHPPTTVGNIASFHRLGFSFFSTLSRPCLPILPLLGPSFLVSRYCSLFTRCCRYLLSNPCREACGGCQR